MLQSFRNKSSVQIALVGLFNLIKGGGIMNINWFWMIIFLMMMTIIGLVVFDSIGASLAFGIATGGIFGLVFSGKKSKKEQE